MSLVLDTFKQLVYQEPSCDDSWFAEALASYRQGDESAGVRIARSCIRFGYEIAEQILGEHANPNLELKLLRSAFAVAIESIDQFEGDSAEEFVRYSKTFIRNRLIVQSRSQSRL